MRRYTKMRSPRVPEKVVQSQIVNLLRSVGAHPYVLGTVRRRGDFHGTMQAPGIADVFCFLPSPRLPACVEQIPGRERHPSTLWVEVKAAGGRLSPEQVEFRDRCAAAHVPHVVGGVDDVVQFLIAGGWLKPDAVPHYRLPIRQGDPKCQCQTK